MAVREGTPFGELVRGHRRALGLTQEELAERAGLSERAIREIERGTKHTPRKETVQLLADALELTGAERETFQRAGRRVGAPEGGEPHSSSELRTFLIADVRGYTRFTQEQGDEAAARLAARFAEVVEEEVSRHGGQLLELRGDEAMVVFSSAREAIRVAIELQHRFAREQERDPSLPLQVGIGLDTGDVVPVKGGYRGGALNLAARLCSLAGAGEVFASEAFVHLARKTEGCIYIDRGEVHLKGLIDPVRVIQIAAEGEILPELPPLEQALVSHPTNLPDEPTPFIGREQEIEAIAGLLQRPNVRLVTLTGPGGTGKTRLALQVGARLLSRFEDGVFLVSLGSTEDPALVPSAMVTTLAVQEATDRSLLEALQEHLRDRHLLLVLDNFEHLLDAAPLVAALLDGCPHLSMLVTSRAVLHLSREHDFAVSPLAVPNLQQLPDLTSLAQHDAVALFIERAQAAKADFALTNTNAPAVAEICSRLDGLPLAIELAAARIRLFPPQALLGRLSSRLTFLTGGPRDLPTRQQTLRGTIDWSYDLLDAAEQTLFARLAVFAGGSTLEATEGVCNAEGDLGIDVLDGIASLVEKSLLRQEGEEEPRFVMLETIREYALERLEAAGEGEALRRRHAQHYRSLAEEAEPQLWGPEEVRWLNRLESEHDNLRAALRWAGERGEIELGLRMASALYSFWNVRGYRREGRRWLDELLAQDQESSDGDGVPLETRVNARHMAAWLATNQGDGERAGTLFEECLALLEGSGDKQGIGWTSLWLGNSLAFAQGKHGEAAPLFERSLALGKELDDNWLIGNSLIGLRAVALSLGDLDRARSLFEECLALSRALEGQEDLVGLVTLLQSAAWVSQRKDVADVRLPTMSSLFEKSLATYRKRGFKRATAQNLSQLGILARNQGDYDRAEVFVEESLQLYRELGDRQSDVFQGEVAQLVLLGLLAQERGDYERATALYEESLALARSADDTFGVAQALIGLADVARALGDAEREKTLSEESLVLFRSVGNQFFVGFALNNLALAARARGDYERAAELVEESLAVMRSLYALATVEVHVSRGLILLDLGDLERAGASFAESLTFACDVGPMWVVAADLEGAAAVAMGQGWAERAARLFGAAESLRAAIGTPIWPVNRPGYERQVAAARVALGDERFAAAWQEGQAMTVEHTVACALEKVAVSG